MKQYLSAPMIVDFNITRRCNLKCKYCYADAGNNCNYDELSFDEIIDILKQLQEMNVQVIRLSGGEPLIRDDYCKIVKECNNMGFYVCTNTNGTLIDSKILKCFKDDCVKSIGISLDSYLSEIHNSLRGTDFAFDSTISGIKKTIQAGLVEKLSVVITITNNNADIVEIQKYFSFLGDIGVKYASFQYAISVGRGEKFYECSPTYKKWRKLVVWLYSSKQSVYDVYGIKYSINLTNESDCKFELFFPFIESNRIDLLLENTTSDKIINKDYLSCEAGNITIAITADGKVYPCELMMSYFELEAGNLRKNSFEEIWNNSSVLNMIRNMTVRDLDGICSSCKMNKECGGGCRAAAYARNHKINDCDQRCPKVKESLDRINEVLNFNGIRLIVRHEYNGYYFSHPNTLRMYRFNKIGYLIFKLLVNKKDNEEIIEMLKRNFNLKQSKAEEEFDSFLAYLRREKLLV